MKFIAFLSLFFIIDNCLGQVNWSQFRGGQGNSVAQQKNLPLEWGSDHNVLWKSKIPGKGWSSPIVWEEKVFITSAVRNLEEAVSDTAGAQQNRGGSRIMPDKDYRFEIYCVNKNTGSVIWKEVAYLGKPGIPTHIDNTYASETPATDGKYVYVYFGMVGLYCYDMDGKRIWEKNLGAFPMQANWGTSSSPIVFKEKLFLQFDNEKNSQVIALDKNTGQEIWRTQRNEISTWSTPYIWKNEKRIELITGGKRTRAYDPDTGVLLWELDMRGGRDISTPTSSDDMIYLCNEERSDGGGILFAVKAGASGDISLNAEENSNEWVAWTVPKSGIAMASPVLCNGYVYALERRLGRVSCIDARTGEFAYQRQKLEGAKAFWASPWVYQNKIFCLDDTGTTHVLECGPEFKVVATNRLNDKFWSTTAAADGVLIFRGLDYVYGIGK